jgi:hypothetical protein
LTPTALRNVDLPDMFEPVMKIPRSSRESELGTAQATSG